MLTLPTHVLLTGAGGPAAISFLRSLTHHHALNFHMADMDPLAQGLYLVEASNRHVVPAGDHPDFAMYMLELCKAMRIHVFVPTVDAELLAIARMRDEFEACGIKVLLPALNVLEETLDKQRLLTRCEGVVSVPRSLVFDDDFICPTDFPVLMKPRSGSGSRGIRVVHDADTLMALPRDPHMLVQEYLPGEEYSVDVVTSAQGEALAAVPRARLKIDSGVAVVARTIHDSELMHDAIAVVEHMGLTGIINVQFKRDAHGTPSLLEVNPRVPGTISLTIAAGVHMPRIALEALLGISPMLFGETRPMEFKELAVVRHLTEVLLDVEDLEAMMKSGQDCKENAA